MEAALLRSGGVILRESPMSLLPKGSPNLHGYPLGAMTPAHRPRRVHTRGGTAATVTVLATGHRVLLEVADEGPGLSETARTRVFERVFRTSARSAAA
jgi:hypothetical protein